ncbi:gamma-glutamyl-gamma-aminobutyrate hydrolase [Kaistia algarum]|uniref:gamma-glutamyl-gamma-aminobutyrate hydrolase family protein n=1 Tax=Kaistia algarum TaxID=2083279 RepID=UPI000CE8F835|nr:gamma-glutamyl-gamma-aminobutyrate hydrolase family protein [Kaistia algarum]MCX5514176.1 gamma-glutamyl-gamma-aminobutyrate hydrolase family protein [Kaistia algarum]PPE77937.1 gamma-glutamyl-gamma-aminobutyrate hydrolase [Kaistia algarum]
MSAETKPSPFSQASPLVAVSADLREADGYRWHAAPDTYLKAVLIGLQGIPVIVPALGEALDIEGLLARVDGLLLTGSRSNVFPEFYGETPDAVAEPYDMARDSTTLPLIRAAIRRGIPLLAICRGFQELNVALGGSLVPEVHNVPGRNDHRSPVSDDQSERFAIRQEVLVTAGGCLGRIVGEGSIRVNSLHRQAVSRLADSLVVEAVAPDGTIEAVSVADAPGFAVGVQWHPEFWVASDAPSARLFRAFGDAMRQRMARSSDRAAAE